MLTKNGEGLELSSRVPELTRLFRKDKEITMDKVYLRQPSGNIKLRQSSQQHPKFQFGRNIVISLW
jgi:hypothetical protein